MDAGLIPSRAWLPLYTSYLSGAVASVSFNIAEGNIYQFLFELNIGAGLINLNFNGDTGANYNWSQHWHGRNGAAPDHSAGQSTATTRIVLFNYAMAGEYSGNLTILPGIGVSTQAYLFGSVFQFADVDNYLNHDVCGDYNGAAAITSFSLTATTPNLSGKFWLNKAR